MTAAADTPEAGEGPEAPENAMVVSFPITCAAIMVKASHCVGFTFPGIIDDPGSLAGMLNSPIPHRGPEADHRISLAILCKAQASVFKAP